MKKIILTTSWDDGHVLDLKLTNLLKKYNIKGTLYIAPKSRAFGAEELLNNSQIKKLSHDFEIGAHTMTHPRLSTIKADESNFEIVESKKYLGNLIGKPVLSFCYPGGDYNSTHIDQVKKASFRIARTTKRFSTNIGKHAYEIPTTIHAYRHWSDAIKIANFAKLNPIKFIKYFLNWDLLATALFDQVLQRGGVFHLWGHSWEIDKNNDWNRLEKVLKYIGKRQNVKYVTNGKLI